MRSTSLLLACLAVALLTTPLFAQRLAPRTPQTVQVTLHRIHYGGSLEAPTQLDASGLRNMLAELRRSDRLESIETMRFPVLIGSPTSIQVGETKPVVVGETSRGGARTQNVSYIQVGTVARLETRLQGETLFVEIRYEATYPLTARSNPDENVVRLGREQGTLSLEATVTPEIGSTTRLHQQQTGDSSIIVYMSIEGASDRVSSATPSARPTPRATAPDSVARPEPRADTPAATPVRDRTASTSRDRYAAYAAAFFRRYDRDEDGSITSSENASDEFFERWDANGDGKVTKDEFVEGLKASVRDRTNRNEPQPRRESRGDRSNANPFGS